VRALDGDNVSEVIEEMCDRRTKPREVNYCLIRCPGHCVVGTWSSWTDCPQVIVGELSDEVAPLTLTLTDEHDPDCVKVDLPRQTPGIFVRTLLYKHTHAPTHTQVWSVGNLDSVSSRCLAFQSEPD